ncbi:MAG: hypothetical protein QM667_03975 [Asticcacaulis sp.]
MTLELTLIGLAACAALTLVSGWLGARPPDLRLSKPRMVPWRFIMLLAATATILLIVHTLTLLGLKNDPPPQY